MYCDIEVYSKTKGNTKDKKTKGGKWRDRQTDRQREREICYGIIQ